MSGLFTQNEYHLAWFAVVDALEKIDPDFLLRKGSGIECAVDFIRELGEAKQELQKLKDILAVDDKAFALLLLQNANTILKEILANQEKATNNTQEIFNRWNADGMPNVNQ